MAAPGLALVSREAGGFHLNLVNNGGGGPFVLEINRASDFASDDTLIVIVQAGELAAGAFIVTGLPNETPFYMRLRNAAGEYSPVVFAATLPVALVPGTTGFAIDKAQVVVPADVMGLGVTFGAGCAQRAGFPPSNLLRDDPQATFQSIADATIAQTFSFQTSGELIDTLALLGTMANDDMNWDIYSKQDEGDAYTARAVFIPFRCSPTLGKRRSYHALHRLAAPVTHRFWQINVGGASRHFLARNLVVGLTRESKNAAVGAQQTTADQSTVVRTRFGGLDSVSGWMGRGQSFDISWLDEAEYHTKWSMLPTMVGKRVPVLAIYNSKRNFALNDRIGYGPLTSIRGENIRASKYSLSVEQDSIY